jgi:formiminotetrahydrofolate cyclodeaminase
MVCRLTTATKGVEAGEGELQSMCAAAETLRARLLAAVDAGAYHLPKDTTEEKAARDAAMAAARLRGGRAPGRRRGLSRGS